MDRAIAEEMRKDPYRVGDLLRDGDIVIDVGANIGAFAAFVLTRCPGATVLCLEPMPDNYSCLLKNVPPSVLAEQVAVAATSGTVTMHDFGPEASACHSMYGLGRSDARPIQVPAKTIEQLLHERGFDHARLLKLDCQGGEYEIIPSAAHEVLARFDFIAMEVHMAFATTREVLGLIQGHRAKRRAMIRHLLVTHLPVVGNIFCDPLHLWKSRGLIPPDQQRVLYARYVRRARWAGIILGAIRSTRLALGFLVQSMRRRQRCP